MSNKEQQSKAEVFFFPAAVLVRAVVAVPVVCRGEQSRGPRFAPAHPAGAAPGLSRPGPPAVPQPGPAAQEQGKPQTSSTTLFLFEVVVLLFNCFYRSVPCFTVPIVLSEQLLNDLLLVLLCLICFYF